MEFLDQIEEIISHVGDDLILDKNATSTPQSIEIVPDKMVEVFQLLHSHQEAYFDSLSCLTGIDNGPEVNSMEVVYNLYSIPMDHALMIKITIPRDHPEIQSVSSIWRTANWHEREAYDLFGIKFIGHPDLRRILMPADWDGHPLRKDYSEPETYHGMRTIRDEENDIE